MGLGGKRAAASSLLPPRSFVTKGLVGCSQRRQKESNSPRVSAASITPSAYLMASTDVPVTIGWLQWGAKERREGDNESLQF